MNVCKCYKCYKCYKSIELTFLNKLMLIKQEHQKSVVIIGIFYYRFTFQPNVCNRCHDLLMMSMNLNDIASFNIKGSEYRCIVSLISKNEAINLMQNPDLMGKAEHYKA